MLLLGLLLSLGVPGVIQWITRAVPLSDVGNASGLLVFSFLAAIEVLLGKDRSLFSSFSRAAEASTRDSSPLAWG